MDAKMQDPTLPIMQLRLTKLIYILINIMSSNLLSDCVVSVLEISLMASLGLVSQISWSSLWQEHTSPGKKRLPLCLHTPNLLIGMFPAQTILVYCARCNNWSVSVNELYVLTFNLVVASTWRLNLKIMLQSIVLWN